MKAVAAVAIGFLIAGVSVTAATASTVATTVDVAEVCVPAEAIPGTPAVGDPTIQVSNHDFVQAVDEVSHMEYTRYTFVHDKSNHNPPTTTPPSDEWNPDNKKDPEDDPIGEKFQQGNGHGPWFFWTSETVVTTVGVEGHAETFSTVPNPDYVPAVEAVDAVTCPDSESTPPSPDKVWVCKYVGKPGVNETLKPGKNPISVSSNATVGEYFNDAHGRSFVLALNPENDKTYTGDLACPKGEGPPPVVSEWYTWDTGSWVPDAVGGPDVSWPQTLVGQGQIEPTVCETTYQQDRYVGTRAEIDAVIDDSQLDELSPGVYEDHSIVKEWRFVSTEACPVELTEVTPTAPTVAPICDADNDTVTITPTTGVKYKDSGWVDGVRTIKAKAKDGYTLVGTTKWTFIDEATPCPIEITGVSVTAAEVPLCGPNNDPLNIPDDIEGLTFDDTGWVDNERTVTAIVADGYVLDGQSSWTFTDEATPCPVTTVAPTVAIVCGPRNNMITIPEVKGVIYTDDGGVGETFTVFAAAAEGYVLTEDSVTSWPFIDVPVEGCPDEPPVFSYTPTGELAYTGASASTNGLTGLAIFLMTAGTALVGLKVRAQR